MSESNEQLVRRIVEEVWNRGNLEVVDATFAPDYLEHNPRPGQDVGTDGYKGGVAMMRGAMSDLNLDVGDILSVGDRIALRYTLRGTHDGELMGVPASGRQVASDGMVFARIRDGMVVERWGVQDMLTLLGQIGALPGPGAAAE